MIYISTAFFIILYGLKFGRVKSLCWMTSITIGIFQGVVISKPINIILISALVAKYGRRQTVWVFLSIVDKGIGNAVFFLPFLWTWPHFPQNTKKVDFRFRQMYFGILLLMHFTDIGNIHQRNGEIPGGSID